MLYDLKFKKACDLIHLGDIDVWSKWQFVRDSSFLPWQPYVDVQAHLNLESYTPLLLKNDLHVLDVRKEHVLLLYDLKLSKACVVLCLKAKFDVGRWRPRGILMPCHFYFPPSLHACLDFESYAPFTILDLHYISEGDLIIWVHDPGVSKGVATKT